MSQSHESFGKYILLEKLQTGGMAEVFLGRAPGASGISRFVAIKRILPQFSEQTEFIDMFKDEAKIAVNLSHANIVSIFEFGMEDKRFYLAMDYVEGRNLRQILNKMKKSNLSFSIEQVLYIIKEVAAGLDHAHRCIDANTGKPLNIIHRDMSPQNIMVSFEGEVKIIDFGIAKAETQLENTRTGTLKGKFGYMSPEQAEGMSLDLRTDIFALGIVLWELLANDRLFVANNEVNTLRKIRDCQIPSLRKINPNIPPELERIVSKALSKDRNMRYQTAAALQRDLSRFLNRQYPDFSPHDFGVFIKTVFRAEILESRSKMVEYAKVEAKSQKAPAPVTSMPRPRIIDDVDIPENNQPTTLTSLTDQTKSEDADDTLGDHDVLNLGMIDDDSPSRENNSEAKTPSKQLSKVSALSEPTSANGHTSSQTITPVLPPVGTPVLKPKKATGIFDLQNSLNGLQIDRTPYKDMSTQTTNTSLGSISRTHSQQKKSDFSINPSHLTAVVTLMAALVGAVLLFKDLQPRDLENYQKEALTIVAKTLGISTNRKTQQTDLSSKKEMLYHNIAITSTPSGAEILINDKPTGDSTPHVLKIEDGVAVKLTVRLQGYKTFEEVIEAKTSRAFNIPLTAEKRGYLDIQVVGSGQIMINNKVISSGSPANRVAVPAEEDVLVAALDPVTRAYDEVLIRVPENGQRRVVLYPQAKSPKSPPPTDKR